MFLRKAMLTRFINAAACDLKKKRGGNWQYSQFLYDGRIFLKIFYIYIWKSRNLVVQYSCNKVDNQLSDFTSRGGAVVARQTHNLEVGWVRVPLPQQIIIHL